ncbi:3'-5' exonuclease [Undibacterium curvum]|uniref:3'-5' exonuclease n=1 Tax=Undibacterium curvum TaxID=2762294 RepID=UPI003D0C7C0D
MNTINKRKDRIMVDLETLGKRAGCAILSIGAVAFSSETNTTGETFYCVVNASSCSLYGLHSDIETIVWWNEQSDDARQVIRHANDYKTSVSIKYALKQFNEYVSKFDNPEIWGNGSDFDNAILIAAMAACGIEPAWKFWNNRCFRTLKNMYPDIKIDRHGAHHNALDDAITQAQHALAILKQPGSVAGFKEAISTWKDATPDAGESNIEAMIQRINWLEKEVTKYASQEGAKA